MPPTDVSPAPSEPVAATQAPPPMLPPMQYGGFWRRVAAALIDGIILGAAQTFVGAMIGNAYTDPQHQLQAAAISAVIGWVYAVYMLVEYKATLGKMALGIHVERTSGEPLTLGHAILREIPGKILSTITFGIGYLMVGWTKKKQGLHDMIADTVVVKNNP